MEMEMDMEMEMEIEYKKDYEVIDEKNDPYLMFEFYSKKSKIYILKRIKELTSNNEYMEKNVLLFYTLYLLLNMNKNKINVVNEKKRLRYDDDEYDDEYDDY